MHQGVPHVICKMYKNVLLLAVRILEVLGTRENSEVLFVDDSQENKRENYGIVV